MTENKLQSFDKNDLWSIDTVTDLVHGDIRICLPITPDMRHDNLRKCRFFSTVNANIGGRVMPVQFEIVAKSLDEALDRFEESAKESADRMIEKIEAQRNRIITAPGVQPKMN